LLVELLSAFVCLAAAAPAVDLQPDDADGLATVRHYSLEPKMGWALRLHRTEQGQLSATLWWVAKQTFAPRGSGTKTVEEATLEDFVFEAEMADVTLADCPALARVASRLEELAPSPGLPGADLDPERPKNTFVVERPGEASIDLTSRAPDDPLVAWAAESWTELKVCADEAE
jgi:hypothetical protein